MQKQFSLKHWRTSAIVVLVALAVTASASQAFAQGQPGESNFYTLKQVADWGNLHASGTLAEARNGGNLLSAWRAYDSANQVWLSFNNGSPFTIGTAETFESPAVVPFGPSNFLVFHTGVDGHIYYAAVSGTNQTTSWIEIPGQTTNMSVSVAPIGQGSALEYLVYRGAGNDTHIYGTWMNAQLQWSSPINLGGGAGVTAPAICLNNTGSSLWVETIGLDNQLWTTSQPLGAANWRSWRPEGVFTGPNSVNGGGAISAPSCAATANGNVVIDYVDTNGHPHYAVFNNGGGLVTEWTTDIVSVDKGWQTVKSVRLTSAGDTVWSLFTGEHPGCGGTINCNGNDGQIWWKTVYVVP
jgi:hypothetical protein